MAEMAENLPQSPPNENESIPDCIKSLRPREQKFAESLALFGGNVLKSARQAGYYVHTYGSSSLYELAKSPKIQVAVAYYRDIFESNQLTSPAKVTAQLATMANADISSVYDENWNTRLKSDLPPEVLQALVGVEVRETRGQRRVTLKFAKEFALEQLAKIHRLYGDTNVDRSGMNLTINMGQMVNNQGDTPTKDGYLGMDMGET